MKQFCRIIALFLVLSFVLPLLAPRFCATEAVNQSDSVLDTSCEETFFIEQELYTKFENDLARFIDADPELGHTFQISEIKPLYDFAENLYYVIECDPTGYLIYHANSRTCMEYSLYCESPYLNCKDNIYYGGVTNYYVVEGDQLVHPLSNEVLTSEDIAQLTALCAENDEKLTTKAAEESTNLLAASGGETVYVTGSSIISNLSSVDSFGYYTDGTSGGNCGYVAAALLLLYYDCVASDRFIDDAKYLSPEGNAYRGRSSGMNLNSGYYNLAKYLYVVHGKLDGEYCNGTAAYEQNDSIARFRGINNVISDYLASNSNVSVEGNGRLMIDVGTVYTELFSTRKPVIMFGLIDKSLMPSNSAEPSSPISGAEGTVKHAVLAYGYTLFPDSVYIISHLGWKECNKVSLNSSQFILGSAYQIDDYSSNEASSKFTDIKYHWGKKYISNCINYGCMSSGMTDTTFGPSNKVTRGMMAEILYRLAGSPQAPVGHPFTDVSNTRYYAKAISWAYHNGIISGITSTQFCPDNYITREQAVTMIHRYADYKNINLSRTTGIEFDIMFEDYSNVSKFAKPSINWAVETGLLIGERVNGKFYLYPKNNITRSELAKLIFLLQRKSGAWR